MSAAVSKPDVFKFDTYRTFLREHIDFLRNESGHSLRSLAKEAGFRSPNYINLIIEGKRNLTFESAERLCKALDLSACEIEFFINLVRFEQAKSMDDRRRHRDEIIKSKRFNNVVPIRSKSVSYYSNWYYVAIREMISLDDFQEDPKWICQKLGEMISPEQAKMALADLFALGLVVRTSAGRLQQVDKMVTADDSITSSALKDFHVVMIGKAQEALETLSYEERDISAITIPVNSEISEQMRLMIVNFRRELLKMSAEAKNTDEVIQVNFQLFPLTRPTSGGSNGTK